MVPVDFCVQWVVPAKVRWPNHVKRSFDQPSCRSSRNWSVEWVNLLKQVKFLTAASTTSSLKLFARFFVVCVHFQILANVRFLRSQASQPDPPCGTCKADMDPTKKIAFKSLTDNLMIYLTANQYGPFFGGEFFLAIVVFQDIYPPVN